MALMAISTTLLLLGILGKSSGAVCGGEYSSKTGTISHPASQSGTYYQSNELCAWVIKSTVPLYFYFSKFNTENIHDGVFARDGGSVGSPLIEKFSGKLANSTFTTKGDAYIQFRSDSNVVGNGFVLHWKVYSTEEQCKEVGGFCVQSGDKCDGIISIIYNDCDDQCVCCATSQVKFIYATLHGVGGAGIPGYGSGGVYVPGYGTGSVAPVVVPGPIVTQAKAHYPGHIPIVPWGHNSDSTEEQCKEVGGICVQSGDKCNGIISIIYNDFDDQCVCCATSQVKFIYATLHGVGGAGIPGYGSGGVYVPGYGTGSVAPVVVPGPIVTQAKAHYPGHIPIVPWGHNSELHEVSLAAQGGVAKATSSHSTGNYEPMKAFEHGGFWHSGVPYDVLPQSLWVELPNLVRVVKYSFTSRTDQRKYIATDGPSKYIFWASNANDCQDVSNWVILKEDNTGVAFKSSNDPKIVVIENNYFYRCYGFLVNDVPGREGIKPVTIGNVHLYSNLECTGVIISNQCLKFSIDKLSWEAARETCSLQNARLASLTDPEAFHDYATMNYGVSLGDDRFWLGGSDSTTEGEFAWINGQALGNQFPWPLNQPDSGDGLTDEDCLSWGYKGTWNDDQCHLSLRFVCEY